MLSIITSVWTSLLFTSAIEAQPMPTALLLQEPPVEEEVVEEPVVEDAEGEEEVVAEAEEVTEEEPEPEPGEDPDSPYLAVVGGDVYSVTRGIVRDGTVLTKNGRILKVGQDVAIPRGARIVDARGMRVYPGLIAVDSRGIIRGGGTESMDNFDPFALYVDLGLAGGLTTVHSNGTVGKLTRGTLDGHLLSTVDWIRLSYSSSSPSGRRQTRDRLEQAREYLRKVRRYDLDKKIGKEDLEEPNSKGVPMDYVALLKSERRARFDADSASDLLAICELLEEFPMDSVIFGGREAWTLASRIGRSGAAVVLTARDKSWADPQLNRPSGWSIENARTLWESGVEFSILPSQTFISLGGLAGRDLLNLPMEVAFAIRGGLSQEAALRSVTLDAARILGVADRIGSIEVGKDADLLITDGDLFDYRTFVQWSIVNGRIAYDKQQASYFAHIRPRAEDSVVDDVVEIIEAVVEDIAEAEDAVEEAEPVEVDAPEADGSGN